LPPNAPKCTFHGVRQGRGAFGNVNYEVADQKPDLEASRDDRLESWGEIATYLRRDVKTVQRWEKRSGLPVYRLVAGRRHPSVYAFREELNRWQAESTLTDSGSTRPLPPGLAEDSLQQESDPPVSSRRLRLAASALVTVAAVALLSSWAVHVQAPKAPAVARPFTHFVGDEDHPAISPDGRQIAYIWRRLDGDRSRDLYVQLIGSNRPLRLTDTPHDEVRPVWSPDGTEIAYAREVDGALEIFAVPALGGTPRLITKTKRVGPASEAFDWSPDGAYLALAGGEAAGGEGVAGGISLFPPSDRSTRLLTRPEAQAPLARDRYPVFSPDGKRLVVSRYGLGQARAVIVGLDGEEQASFTTEAVNGHAWSADGQSLVFARARAGSGELQRLSLSDGKIENLPFGAAEAVGADVRGDLLAFSRWRFDSNLRSLDLAGEGDPARSQANVLVKFTSIEHSPAFSPDGRRIAFASNRSGVNEIWTCDRDGGSPAQLTFRNENQTGSPKWSPDSRWIAFDSHGADGETVGVYVVHASGGEPRRVTPPDLPARLPSWSRDGRWIYFVVKGNSFPADLYKTPVQGGEPILVAKGAHEAVESADGRTLYFSLGGGRPGLWSLDLATGERELVAADGGSYRYWATSNDGLFYVPGSGHSRDMRPFRVERLDLSSGRTTHVATLDFAPIVGPSGLAVAPDESRLVVASVDLNDRDVILVEGFE